MSETSCVHGGVASVERERVPNRPLSALTHGINGVGGPAGQQSYSWHGGSSAGKARRRPDALFHVKHVSLLDTFAIPGARQATLTSTATRKNSNAPWPECLNRPQPSMFHVKHPTDQLAPKPGWPSTPRMRLRSPIVAKSTVIWPFRAPRLIFTRVSRRSPRFSASSLRCPCR